MKGSAITTILGAATALALGCSSSSAGGPSTTCTDENGNPLPVAPTSARVDRYNPTFSTPLAVTNPLNPIAQLDRVILLGSTDGARFRVETTLLPYTKTIHWNGQDIEALVSQYVAFSDGRIHEVALDWYAQADDGSVWYLGENVYNYENGRIVDTDGTWLTGRDGRGAMIMGSAPAVGQVWRPENICGLVFEEVTVKQVGVTVQGPRGPVSGAIIIEELHQDATTEDKTFAPGYGEFSTGAGADLEAVALALPIDALGGAVPSELVTLSAGAEQVFDSAGANNWTAASGAVGSLTAAWNTFKANPQPPMIAAQMDTTIATLAAAVAAQQSGPARQASIDVARVTLDLRLRHEPRATIDLGLIDLWVRQVLVDTEAGDQPGIAGDIATLKWMRDRMVTDVEFEPEEDLDAAIANVSAAAEAGDLPRARAARAVFNDVLRGLARR